MSRQASCVLLLTVTASVAGPTFAADDWPHFRGPRGDGHAEGAELPLEWSETKNVTWKVPVPGRGHSSPVISGNRVWLTTAIVEELTEEEEQARLAKLPTNSRGIRIAGSLSLRALCFDTTMGKALHDVEVFRIDEPGPVHSLNSYASPTPILEGDRVYVHFGSYGTACMNAETGEPVWTQRSLVVDHQNGPGASPILWKDLLIAQYDGIDRQFVAALDKDTGKPVWQTKRSGKLPDRPEFQKAYCTPTVVTTDDGSVLISPGSDWVYGYDPASGEELWKAAYGKLGFSTVPKPVVGHGMAFISTSFIQPRLLAVKYDGRGDVSDSHVAWVSDRNAPNKPSLLLHDEGLFVVADKGVVSCMDPLNGDVLWRDRLDGEFSASPLFAGDRIFAFDQDGKCIVFAASADGFEKLAENHLDEGCMGSPAVTGDALIVRTKTHLYRIEVK